MQPYHYKTHWFIPTTEQLLIEYIEHYNGQSEIQKEVLNILGVLNKNYDTKNCKYQIINSAEYENPICSLCEAPQHKAEI